jgi:hypothetical protein
MKRTYTPSLEELSRQYGEQYFTVTTREAGHKSEPALDYGTLEDLVSIADATIFNAYGDAADLDRYSIRISYAGRELVYIPCVGDGPDSAQVMPQPAGDTYEVREIDAWAEYDDPEDPEETPSWVWNTSYNIGTFTTAGDPARALRRYLKDHHGVTFYRGRTVTEYDGDVYEIVDRATRQPLFAAIPQEV